MEAAFLVPVKAFHLAKRRLRGHLPDTDRIRLARWLAERVLGALDGRAVFVACDDDAVAQWARQHGAEVLWGPGLGLNGAVDAGVAEIAECGFDHVTICHGDLPFPASLPTVAIANTIVLVPDRRGEGTNVISRPVAVDFPAQYGPDSFPAHLAAANATGLTVRVRRDAELSLDFDTIDDAHDPMVQPLVRELLGHTGMGER